MRPTAFVVATLLLAAHAGGEEPRGRWHPAPSLVDPELRRLQTIGYLSGSIDAPLRSGVTRYLQHRVANGLNFYTSGHEPGATLIDMRGEVLHRWYLPYRAIAPPGLPLPEGNASSYWRRAHLFENGDVLAIFEGVALVKVDRSSRLLWAHRGGQHHDLAVTEDGRIHVLTRRARHVESGTESIAVLEDAITTLSADGELLAHLPLVDLLRSHGDAALLATMPEHGDLLHTNSLEILDDRLADRHPAFRAGRVLVSFRSLDAIAVVDLEAEEIPWIARGSWRKQHDPTLVDGGILLFDNAPLSGHSTVLEFDPVTGTEDPVYGGKNENHDILLFSNTCGTARRLTGGTTLITESDAGRSLEVGEDGEVLWEFRSPHRAGPDDGLVATLFELTRLPPDFPFHWTLGPEAAQAVRADPAD